MVILSKEGDTGRRGEEVGWRRGRWEERREMREEGGGGSEMREEGRGRREMREEERRRKMEEGGRCKGRRKREEGGRGRGVKGRRRGQRMREKKGGESRSEGGRGAVSALLINPSPPPTLDPYKETKVRMRATSAKLKCDRKKRRADVLAPES